MTTSNNDFLTMIESELADYSPGAPSGTADQDACECAVCHSAMTYQPYCKNANGHLISYRAFMVCGNCDNWLEF